jgi:hypothetical protein
VFYEKHVLLNFSFLSESSSYYVHIISSPIEMLVFSTLASKMRILCIRKHLTIDPCYGPLYCEMMVLIDNLCLRVFYTYGWFIVVSLDYSIKTNLIIWEAPGQCGIIHLVILNILWFLAIHDLLETNESQWLPIHQSPKHFIFIKIVKIW